MEDTNALPGGNLLRSSFAELPFEQTSRLEAAPGRTFSYHGLGASFVQKAGRALCSVGKRKENRATGPHSRNHPTNGDTSKMDSQSFESGILLSGPRAITAIRAAGGGGDSIGSSALHAGKSDRVLDLAVCSTDAACKASRNIQSTPLPNVSPRGKSVKLDSLFNKTDEPSSPATSRSVAKRSTAPGLGGEKLRLGRNAGKDWIVTLPLGKLGGKGGTPSTTDALPRSHKVKRGHPADDTLLWAMMAEGHCYSASSACSPLPALTLDASVDKNIVLVKSMDRIESDVQSPASAPASLRISIAGLASLMKREKDGDSAEGNENADVPWGTIASIKLGLEITSERGAEPTKKLKASMSSRKIAQVKAISMSERSFGGSSSGSDQRCNWNSGKGQHFSNGSRVSMGELHKVTMHTAVDRESQDSYNSEEDDEQIQEAAMMRRISLAVDPFILYSTKANRKCPYNSSLKMTHSLKTTLYSLRKNPSRVKRGNADKSKSSRAMGGDESTLIRINEQVKSTSKADTFRKLGKASQTALTVLHKATHDQKTLAQSRVDNDGRGIADKITVPDTSSCDTENILVPIVSGGKH
jgi:hypothetical protein